MALSFRCFYERDIVLDLESSSCMNSASRGNCCDPSQRVSAVAAVLITCISCLQANATSFSINTPTSQVALSLLLMYSRNIE